MTPVKTMIVPARPGLKVRKPADTAGRSGHLAEDGEAVAWSPYWQRRLDDGDVALKKPERRPADKGSK